MMEAMDYVVGTIHAQGFRQVFRAVEMLEDQDAVRARGLKVAEKGFAIIDTCLADKDWLAGDFSLADPALFYVSYWAGVLLKTGLPPNVEQHFERMIDRPAVRKALEDEGL
jgi:glutathione S-transferase